MNKLTMMLGALATCSSLAAFAQEDTQQQLEQQQQVQQQIKQDQVEFNGSISAVSAYVSRGGTNGPENDEATIQAGLGLSYKGFYAGYWGSKLGYSYSEDQKKATFAKNNPQLKDKELADAQSNIKASSPDFYEHDFLLGYASKYNDLSYDLQVATYVYPGSDHSTGVEAGVFLNHPLSTSLGNSVSISLQSYLNDTIYMNQGDTYMELGYEHPLPQGFKANLSSGFSWFQDSGKYEGGKNGGVINTTEDFVLRHATIQVSHDLFNDPKATGWVKYVIGGENRSGENQKNMVVAGLRYAF